MNEVCYWVFCFVPVATAQPTKIFGFSEFLTALALLVVVYTVMDVRYKFRIAVAPGFLYTTTFSLIATIGAQTLLTEIWLAQGWWVPETLWLTPAIWEGIFGFLFLGAFLTWMYYGFIRPPIFGRRNGLRFGQELYRYILRGNDDELKVIANELVRSTKSLVKQSRGIPAQMAAAGTQTPRKRQHPSVGDFAHDILLLIANRKFCRLIVSSSPVTAQAFFEDMARSEKFDIPLGHFARNISSEAILQPESFLYVEAEGFQSGLLGYLKPVSHAVYGNYHIVRALGDNFASPFDIHYEEIYSWTPNQWKAYCRAALITLKSYLKEGWGSQASPPVINRIFSNLKMAFRDAYKMDGISDPYNTDMYQRLSAVVDFTQDMVHFMNEMATLPTPFPKVHENTYPKNIYDNLGQLFFEMCFAASQMKGPADATWMVHYVLVWDSLFDLDKRRGSRIVREKVCRLLYDEITRLTKFPNYKGARILGYCLNILGIYEPARRNTAFPREAFALAKAVQSWARKGYLQMRAENQDVANAVLIGSISFDSARNRFVKTYAKGLHREAPKHYMQLDLPQRVRSVRLRTQHRRARK